MKSETENRKYLVAQAWNPSSREKGKAGAEISRIESDGQWVSCHSEIHEAVSKQAIWSQMDIE